MKKILSVMFLLMLTACGAKIEGTFVNNMTGVDEQKMRWTFNKDGTARMSIGSSTLPLVIPFKVNGDTVTLSGVEGDQIAKILENGDLVMNGIRFAKESAVPQAAAQESPKAPSSPEMRPAPAAPTAPPSQVARDTSATPQANAPHADLKPSFDCAKAATIVEKAVCSDTLLGKLDGALSTNYKSMLASNIGDGARNDLKATQKSWIGIRNACRNNQCISESYRTRIKEVCDYPVESGVHPGCIDEAEIH